MLINSFKVKLPMHDHHAACILQIAEFNLLIFLFGF
jgi:hypothetical protein